MKFLVALLAIALVFPLGLLARRRDGAMRALATLIGLLPFLGSGLAINVISFEKYRGDSRGLELTVLDLCAGILFVALGPRPRQATPLAIPRWAYLGALLLSITAAPNPLFAMFSVWKLLRMYFLFAVAVRGGARLANALVTGMGAGLVLELLLSLDQRYHQGLMRVSGNLMHPNSLAMAVNLVFPIAFALVLSQRRARLATAAAMSAALCVVLSLSRGALAMLVLSGFLVYLGSSMRKLEGRKIAVAALAAVASVIVAIKAGDTILERFAHAPKASEEARVLFNRAAAAMLGDHPLGVGINQFSYVLSHAGYADRAGIPAVDRDGIAHHVYWLTAAETGYLGLASYLLVLAAPLFLAVRGAIRLRDVRGDVLLGCAVGLTVTYLQGTAEWIARQTAMSYLFWMIAAVVVVLERPLRAAPR